MTDSGKVDYESLKEWVLHLPHVTQASHRFGGAEFRVHGLEFMHFHGYAHLDIRLSKQDQMRVLMEGKAEEHRYAPHAGWVTFRIRSRGSIPRVKELIELAYKNARNIMEIHMARRERAEDRLLLHGT